MYCNVLIIKPFDQTFTYKVKNGQHLDIGSVVNVPFGKKKDEIGIVYDFFKFDPKAPKLFEIKEINFSYKNVLLNKKIIKFIDWVASYTLAPKGLVLRLFLINKKIVDYVHLDEKEFKLKPEKILLNLEQKKAANIIDKSLFKPSKPIVLEGVTGSGKTEVYFEALEKILIKKKQALILLPEISLTPQLEIRFFKRFGFKPDVWHSKISESKRKNIWHRCLNGNSMVVIGARSSLFLPFKKLELIVVDEEHDLSFKQEDIIRYHARDLAIVRSNIEKFPIILSSATPSLETQNNIIKKDFVHLNLKSQFSGLDLPQINLIDLQINKLEKQKWISPIICDEIEKCIKKGEQALLFLNRRGYSPLSICSECSHRFQCNYCSTWLVMHKDKNRLLCHHCGSVYPAKPTCPKCKISHSLKFIGPGIERVADEIKSIFPKFKVGIMSSDNANSPNKTKKIIEDFTSKNIEILVATQIMAKGYDFPNLSLVAVIDADAGLMGGDIRAIERTYNLLQQVSGRAGRSQQAGKVFIQTHYPDQPLIQSLKNRDRKTFIDQILAERKQFNSPPFSSLTALIISGTTKSVTESYAIKLVKSMNSDEVSILGPVEAPIFLLRGKYRYRILLKSKNRRKLNNFTRNLVKANPIPSNLRLTIDVDPYTFV